MYSAPACALASVLLLASSCTCDGLVWPQRAFRPPRPAGCNRRYGVVRGAGKNDRPDRPAAELGDQEDPPLVEEHDQDAGTISLSDERLFEETLTSTRFIQWAGDLSLRWPRVGAIEEGASPLATGKIKKGDQLVSINGEFLAGAHVKEVIGRLAMCRVSGSPVELVMFRGTPDELEEVVTRAAEATGAEVFLGPKRATEAVITVLQDGEAERTVTVPAGTNLRDALVGEGINVYRSLTRWTNCSGKQLCGTCVVQVLDGMPVCSARSLNEITTLRENPEDHRISCRTNVHGDVTVKVMGAITETTP